MQPGHDLEMVRDAIRAFVVDNIAPHAAAWDRDRTFPAQALKGLAALGCFGIAVPGAMGRRRARLRRAGGDPRRDRGR